MSSEDWGGYASRRAFLAASAAAAAGMAAASADEKAAQLPPKLKSPEQNAATERQNAGPPSAIEPGRRVGYAIVGLGKLSLEQILPAFGKCHRSRPVALVSGDKDKAAAVARQYGIDPGSIYDYRTYDRLRDNPAVDAVYIVLPNSMHLEFTERAAGAGKHVLSEKPMAGNAREAEQMISTCQAAGRQLMIAYRCQYEPYNRALTKLVRDRELGPVRTLVSHNVQDLADNGQWRLKKALAGGGSLPDIGIYCLNAFRYLTGEEPISISAQVYSPPGDPRFKEVEDQVAFQLRFPSGIVAQGLSGYSAHESRHLRVLAEGGWAELDPAFSYEGQRMRIARAVGMAEDVVDRSLAPKDHFAAEMDHFAECLVGGKRPRTPGEEGLQDHRLMERIYEAAREGRTLALEPVARLDAFRGPEPSPA